MSKSAGVRDQLIAAFRTGLSLSADVDIPSLTYRGISQWDSVGHMQLVAEIEGQFEIMMETDQVIDMSSFDKALEILAVHGIDLAN